MALKEDFCKVEKIKSAKLLYAAGEKCADIRYAAGFSTPDEFIWCGFEDGSATVVLSPLEYSRGAAGARAGVEVLPESDFGTFDRRKIIGAIARRHKIDTWLVPADFPLALADGLRRDGFSVAAVEGEFLPQREFKSEDECRMICDSIRAAEAGAARGFEVIGEAGIASDNTLWWQGEKLTSEILRTEIDLAQLKAGAMPMGTICAGGLQSAQPHNTGSGQLYAETPIVMDIFPRSMTTGYWGDLTRTVVKGKAPEIVARAFEAVFEARELGKNLLAPGVIPDEVHRRVTDLLTEHGFPTGRDGSGNAFGFFHGLGHGLGLDIHESPRVSLRNNSPLKGGEVVTVEPGVYYPEWGGIRLEDVVMIVPGGVRVLTEIATPFEIP